MKSKVQAAVDALRTANEMGSPAFLFTGGKDSMIIADLYRRHDIEAPQFIAIDTGNQFDAIVEFRDDITDEWGFDLETRRNDEFIENVIENPDDDRGYAWDGPKTDGCCGALKIDPMSGIVADGFDPLIVGRRAEDVGGDLPVFDHGVREPVPHDRVHPLADWSNAHIDAYIQKNNVPLPVLYEKGYTHTDCIDCVMKGEDGDDWSDLSAEKQDQLNALRDMGYM